jgi:uncharacterized DUF497 family protein
VADMTGLRLPASTRTCTSRVKELLYRAALSELSIRLDPMRFVRVHRFAIVNIESIVGEFEVVLKDGSRSKVSRSYRAHLLHIKRHEFTSEEVEEVFASNYKVRRTRQKRYIALGETLHGRLAFVVFRRLPGGVIRVVTARDMEDKERRLFRRK